MHYLLNLTITEVQGLSVEWFVKEYEYWLNCNVFKDVPYVVNNVHVLDL